jgi:hypothetical protein
MDRDREAQGRRRYRGPRDRTGRPLPRGSADELGGRVEPEKVVRSPGEAFEQGVRLFDEERFFEAHEFFEYIWNCDETDAGDRDFWRGVAQVAVGFCHAQRGNPRGAVTTLERAASHLERYPRAHHGVDTGALAASARRVASEIEARGAPADQRFPRFPLARTPRGP